MKILSWNVNGYRAAWKKGFREWLASVMPEVICLQETKSWAEQLTPDQLNPVGYSGIFSQPERKGYSGVATFCLNPPDLVKNGFGIERFDREGRILITRHQDLVLANIYFPNGKQNSDRLAYKMDFYEATLDYFDDLVKQGENLIVVGDYNTAHKPNDLARPEANKGISGFLPEERAWIDRWIEAGFVDIFREFNNQPEQYTWWDFRTRARERNTGWRIDYFFVNQALVNRIKNAWIMPEVTGSDHCPIGIELV